MMRITSGGTAVLCAGFVLWAAVASGQTKPAQQGPLVLEPTGDGPVIAPEVKYGRFDHNGGTLVGAYGGWLLDNRLLLGAGADFLVDHNYHDPVAGMGYGGFVVGWLMPGNHVFNGGVRALVGFGQASLTDSASYPVPFFPDHHHGAPYGPAGSTVVQQVHFHDGFFIFEPQATAVVRVSRILAIDVAGGYRLVTDAGIYNERLRGPSLTVGLRVGP